MQLTITEATDLAMRALTRAGMTPDNARITADHLVDAALCGHEFSSLPRVIALAEAIHTDAGFALDLFRTGSILAWEAGALTALAPDFASLEIVIATPDSRGNGTAKAAPMPRQMPPLPALNAPSAAKGAGVSLQGLWDRQPDPAQS